MKYYVLLIVLAAHTLSAMDNEIELPESVMKQLALRLKKVNVIEPVESFTQKGADIWGFDMRGNLRRIEWRESKFSNQTQLTTRYPKNELVDLLAKKKPAVGVFLC